MAKKLTLELDDTTEKAMLDGVEDIKKNVLDQIKVQMRQQAANRALQFFRERQGETDEVVSVPVDEDALLNQYFAHPQYKNAQQRREEAEAKQQAKKEAVESARKKIEEG